MITPVKSINQKVGILKMGWLVVEDVLMEPVTVIVYYGRQRPLKMSEKDLKRVSWGLVGSHDFKPIAYRMWTVDCENTWV